MFKIGDKVISVLGGYSMYPILNSDGETIATTVGSREEAEELVRLLNEDKHEEQPSTGT